MKLPLSSLKRLGGEIAGPAREGCAWDTSRVVTDSRVLQQGDWFWPLSGDQQDGHRFMLEAVQKGCEGLVADPRHAPPEILKECLATHPVWLVPDTLNALWDLAFFVRSQSAAQVIAVTGSNGKTTTKELLGQVLRNHFPAVHSRRSFNNHIGVPLTLLSIQEDTRFAVVEIGMNHAGEISQLTRLARPDIGVILNVSPAHIGHFPDFAALVSAKAELAAALPEGATLFLNRALKDYPVFRSSFHGRILEFGPFVPGVYGGYLPPTPNGTGIVMPLRIDQHAFSVRYPGLGLFNAENVSAAAAVCVFLGLSPDAIRDGIAAFHPASMRMEKQTLPMGAVCINDAYNANPASAVAALEVLESHPCDGKRHFLFGSMKELGWESERLHAAFADRVSGSAVDHVYVMGEEARNFEDAALRGDRPEILYFTSRGAMLEAIRKRLKAGDLLLIKGSRAHRLETLIPMLSLQHGETHV